MGYHSLDVTTFLVILTGIISWQAFKKPEVMDKLLFNPYRLKHHREWIRMLSGGFVHGNLMHLLVNLYMLYMFGSIVEMLIGYMLGPVAGPVVYALFYLGAIAAAGIPAYLRHQDDPNYGELGASGATSAIVMIYIMMDPWQWFLFPPLPAIVLGIAYLWYSQYMSRQYSRDHIAHGAHFAGAVYGVLFIIITALIAKPAFLEQFLSKLLQGPTWPF